MAEDLDIKENEELVVPETKLSADDLLMLQEMADLGLFYGLSKTKTNPKMRPYIHSTRSGVEVINIEKTIDLVKKAADFLQGVLDSGKTILFVGATPAGKQAIQEFSEKNNYPYVSNRWLGGTLTNFKVISSRIDKFKKLTADKEAGTLVSRYTKKERLMIERELEKMNEVFSGIKDMAELPGAVFVANLTDHKIAAHEARRMKIPVVPIVNTNVNPEDIDYPIPANDRTSKSINWVLNYLSTHLKKDEHREHREA